MMSFAKLKRTTIAKPVLLVLLTLLVGLGALPGYWAGGKWRWMSPPAVSNFKAIKQIKQTGIELPGWLTTAKQTPTIGEHTWLVQTIQDASNTRATVLLFPQNGPIDQPAVEWTDLDGVQRWKSDSERTVTFVTDRSTVSARFRRTWTARKTYAVLQWYAWAEGGDASPLQWFLRDRMAQWQGRQRVGWVAVSILLPIEPLDDIDKSWTPIESIAQKVQASLTETAFKAEAR